MFCGCQYKRMDVKKQKNKKQPQKTTRDSILVGERYSIVILSNGLKIIIAQLMPKKPVQ